MAVGWRDVRTARTRFRVPALYYLLTLAFLYTLYFAKTLLMPLLVALLFALLLNPSVKTLKRFYVPRTVSAILLLAAIGVPFTLLGAQLVEPVQKWVSRLPELSATITKSLDSMTESVTAAVEQEQPPTTVRRKKKGLLGWFGAEEEVVVATPPEEKEEKNEISQHIWRSGLEASLSALSAAPIVITQFLTFVIVTLFLLIFGPQVYTRATEVLPQIEDKESAAQLVESIQQELSRYILTVSVINCGLGAATALALWMAGVEDALLWGVVAGLMNFAPYIGPLVCVIIFTIAGVVQYGFVWMALLPGAIYFVINLVEAQALTPLVLGQHMRLNPLLLMLWLLLWGWLWGAVGVLLAVPLLVCLKLVAKKINPCRPWVELIEA